jgi:hypothetical protein
METQSAFLGKCLRRLSGESAGRYTFCLLFPLLLLLGWGGRAVAQGLTSPGGGSAPEVRGVGVRAPAQLSILNSTQDSPVKKHMGPTGKPCLTVLGYAQQQSINPNLFDHMISASNDCSQPIKMTVCYYQTQQCLPIDVPAYGRKEVVLGIMPAMKQFQFEYRELFIQGMGNFGVGLN